MVAPRGSAGGSGATGGASSAARARCGQRARRGAFCDWRRLAAVSKATRAEFETKALARAVLELDTELDAVRAAAAEAESAIAEGRRVKEIAAAALGEIRALKVRLLAVPDSCAWQDARIACLRSGPLANTAMALGERGIIAHLTRPRHRTRRPLPMSTLARWQWSPRHKTSSKQCWSKR